MQYSSSK